MDISTAIPIRMPKVFKVVDITNTKDLKFSGFLIFLAFPNRLCYKTLIFLSKIQLFNNNCSPRENKFNITLQMYFL